MSCGLLQQAIRQKLPPKGIMHQSEHERWTYHSLSYLQRNRVASGPDVGMRKPASHNSIIQHSRKLQACSRYHHRQVSSWQRQS